MATTATHQDGALRGVVAVGASAGGVGALTSFAAGLPENLPYAILIVLHLPPGAPSVLASIVDRSGPLPAMPGADGAELEAGRIYVAVPDRHLLVRDRRVILIGGLVDQVTIRDAAGAQPTLVGLLIVVALAAVIVLRRWAICTGSRRLRTGADSHRAGQGRLLCRFFPSDLGRCLVRPQPTPARLTQPTVTRSFAVAHLAHQHRLHERHTFGVLRGKPFAER